MPQTESPESYIEPTEIIMGRNQQGQECIVIATLPGGHTVDWYQQVHPQPMPKRARGKQDAQSARDWADAVTEWAQNLREAADWADVNADKLNGPDGPA